MHRAVMFAVAASGAFVLVHPWDGDRIARFFLEYDRFIGTDFVTDHAAFLLFPCKTTGAINDRRARFSPDTLLGRQRFNGIGGTHLAAHGAFRVAVTASGGQSRTEEGHETGIEPDGLKGIGGASRHTLAAADAPGQKCRFGKSPRWSEKIGWFYLTGPGFTTRSMQSGQFGGGDGGAQKTGV